MFFTGEKAEMMSSQLRKARRMAQRAKTYSPCVACLAYGKRCSDTRPCSRCIKLSNPCIRAAKVSNRNRESDHEGIERPIAQPGNVLAINTNGRTHLVLELSHTPDWFSKQLIRMAAKGHKIDDLASLLVTITKCFDIGHALSLAKAMTQNCMALQYSQANGPPETSATSFFLQSSQRACELSTDADVGFLSIIFDPLSRRRQQLHANPRMADLFGMHHEEFLARTASGDLPLPFTDLDSVLIVIYMATFDLVCGAGKPREVFVRLRSGRGRSAHGRLVSAFGIADGGERTREV